MTSRSFCCSSLSRQAARCLQEGTRWSLVDPGPAARGMDALAAQQASARGPGPQGRRRNRGRKPLRKGHIPRCRWPAPIREIANDQPSIPPTDIGSLRSSPHLPFCAAVQPIVSAMHAKLPPDVHMVFPCRPRSAAVGQLRQGLHRAEAIIIDKTHDAMFRAIHLDKTLKGERGMDTRKTSPFYAAHGADPKQFTSSMAARWQPRSTAVSSTSRCGSPINMTARARPFVSTVVTGEGQVDGRHVPHLQPAGGRTRSAGRWPPGFLPAWRRPPKRPPPPRGARQ